MTNSPTMSELPCPGNKGKGRHHFVPVFKNGELRARCLTCHKTQEEVAEDANAD